MADLMSVKAHWGPHANLYEDPHGGRLPPAPEGGDKEFSRVVLGERRPGTDAAFYPRDFVIGLSYSPMTYVWGEQTDGEVATHDQIRGIAMKVLGESCKPVWLYKGMEKGRTTWYAAFRAHHIGLDPCQQYITDKPNKRLAALLMRAIGPGAEELDMGFLYGAEVYLPEPVKVAA